MSQVAALWARDKRRCWICTRGVGRPDASRDHIRPFSEGGYNKARNYRLAHRVCNTARGALPESTVRQIVNEAMPCSTTRLCELLRNASVTYYTSVEHAERKGTAMRQSVALRKAKRERREHRAARRAAGKVEEIKCRP